MSFFPIDWQPQFQNNLRTSTLRLDDEWAIVCVIKNVHETPFFKKLSIEIHRKHTDGEFSLSGELTVQRNGMEEREFSRFIKNGSSFTEIVSNLNFMFGFRLSICGFVNITEFSDKCSDELKSGESKENIHLQSLEELSNDFMRLLEPKESCFADIFLKCGGASIPAHKNILSARSPVFAAMFAHPMKENRKNEVEITDIEVSVLRTMLNYIYTGKTSDLNASSAADLLFAADKYQLQNLKKACSYILKDTITLQNVLKVLVMGDMHAEDLKLFALDYICTNCVELSVLENIEEWKTLQKERPALAMDVLVSLVKSKEEKSKR